MNTIESAGSMVLVTRLAKAVHKRSTEEILGIRLRHFTVLVSLREYGVAPQHEVCELLGELSAEERETLHQLLARALVSRGHPAGDGYTQSTAELAAG